jgi:predicted dehydrogenase
MSDLVSTPSTMPLAATARPRLGFLGAGWIGRNRLEALARGGNVEIVAVADTDPEAAERAAACAPRARALGSFSDLLDEELDGIVIATPSAQHAEQCIAAFERGFAVFCQKPLARTQADTRRVVESAEAADRLLGVDLSYRYTRGIENIRALVRSGGLGEVYLAHLTFHNAYGPDKPWFYEPRLAGGGCLMDLGTHLVDLALFVLDHPPLASATSRLFSRGKPVVRADYVAEDYATARLDFATGQSANVECSWRLHAGRDAVIEAAFYGTDGGAALRNVDGSFYDFTAEWYRGTRRGVLAAPPDDWGGRAVSAWAERLRPATGFDRESWKLVELARVLDVVYGR